ncbi:MAG: PQQ-binding-like beta-propeller repeat protein [Phycisphaerae bacterium]|nr:PQQ-binding-like beta-propeller repeat protein [Phycisphaerae bacterium]MCZ2400223.1 PQQ-binding-like beta-propeller repeat protein [Phycisphaerae bacterium]
MFRQFLLLVVLAVLAAVTGREALTAPPPGRPGADVMSNNPNDWPMYNRAPDGSRHNFAETKLRPSNVANLQVLWSFPTDGAVAGTPAVVDNIIYAADSMGFVYAINSDGTLRWKNDTIAIPSLLGIKITNSLLVTNRTVIFGDTAGQIHGLERSTGELRWTIRPPCEPLFPEGHPFQAILGAGTMAGHYVAYGISSYELALPAIDPDYPGFTFRGSVILLDPADGNILWQTYLVGEPQMNPDGSFGPSGASVWGTPAYDHATKTIFVGTSNNYGPPATDTSDALIALNVEDGSIRWVSQMTADDTWNFSFLPVDPNDPPDFDFGDSPQLYRVQGQLRVAAGQKSGFFHVVDAATGASLTSPVQYLPGGTLGGFHMDSASAGGVNFATGNYWFDPFSGGQPEGGAVFAISPDGTQELWRFDTPGPIIAGTAVANGVVYVQSLDGMFYALDASSGAPLLQADFGGQSSGPSISRGRIYLGTGDVMSSVFDFFYVPVGGSVTALGLPQ